MKSMNYGFGLLALIGALLSSGAWAVAPVIDNPNAAEKSAWEEQPVTAAPTYSSQHLLAIDMPKGMSVAIAVDPQTITVGSDGVARYVVVTRNQSGSENAFFEGIRCEAHQVKTYARHDASGDWIMTTDAVWKSFNDNFPSRHAVVFALQAVCKDGTAQTRDALIDSLKHGIRNTSTGGLPY